MPRTNRLLVTAAARAVLSLPPAALAASDYFLKIQGIEGESTDERHKGEIEILSWSLGASVVTASTQQRAAGKSCVQDIAFTKNVDLASPPLLANAVTGLNVPAATFTARKAGERAHEYLKIELKDVLVTSVSSGGSTGGIPVENVTLGFSSMTLKYEAQGPTGGPGKVVQVTIKGGC